MRYLYCATSISWHFCPERARHTLGQSFSLPLQGGKIIGAPSPRALPWAKMQCPCRAEDASNPRNQNVNLLALYGILTFLLILCSPLLYAQEQEQTKLDAETQKLWDAHTVVPKTDDIKALRAFLKYGSDDWDLMQMIGRLRTIEMWQRFDIERNKATFEAADRILALAKDEPGEEPPPPKTQNEYRDNLFGSIWEEEIGDVKFALRYKIAAFGDANTWNPDWAQHFRDFIEEMKKNPAHKGFAKYAESNWFGFHFNAAVFPKGELNEEGQVFEDNLRAYQENFENLKNYCVKNIDDPYLKFEISYWKMTQIQAAEILEGRGKLKKGTLVIPALEFYRSLYEKHSDAPEAEEWLRNINNDLVKYEVLTAADPFAAFQIKVTELKQSLETELNEDSCQKVWALNQIAEEMERRDEALRLVLTTACPIFEASKDGKIRDFALGFNVQLKQLALEGVEFELEGILIDGTKINLKDYRGKVVVLDYWATWCGPCVGDIPQLKTFYKNWVKEEEAKGKVELIGFSVDEDLDALKKLIDKKQIPWPNISEKLSLEQKLPDSRKKYGIDAYPTTILLDQTGKVVRVGNGLYSVIMEIRKLIPAEEKK